MAILFSPYGSVSHHLDMRLFTPSSWFLSLVALCIAVGCTPTKAAPPTLASPLIETEEAPIYDESNRRIDESVVVPITNAGSDSAATQDDGSCLGLPPLEADTSNARSAVPPERRNIEGNTLQTCSLSPLTGWFRDGLCRTDDRDRGIHVVCASVNEAFLAFTKERGNDLSTPKPKYGFPGLKPGDRWCLCAARWYEAQRAGKAPSVVLNATHEKALTIVSLDILRKNRSVKKK